MEFTLGTSLGVLVVLVALGVAGLVGGGMMTLQTTLMMVAPSMLVFGLIAFALGMKHGEFRATR
ncbi:hypothetical protein BRC83_07005 [Halobacteriales archaeon QS_1_68_17]|nr:MAG: hypothetical protein BRC83_07005 [Halobacteriales archaeon QS_1_68_17]